MLDITIPRDSQEAVLAILRENWRHTHPTKDVARAACLAMLAAWPGVREAGYKQTLDRYGMRVFTDRRLILPLPAEKPNDKA
jgi:hypothetical protein